jgi:hypothetical protein
MPIRYVYRSDLMFEVWTGLVTLDDWRRHLLRVFGETDFANTGRHLVDIRFASTDESFDEDGMVRLTAELTNFRSVMFGRKIALVVLQDFEKAKFFEHIMKNSGFTAIAFSDIDTASTWLGIPVAQAIAETDRLRNDTNA